MTTIAKKKPAEFRIPVYVTKDRYEVWHCTPSSLGHVERRGNYWYTEDGLRFASSRDAMDYLVRISHLRNQRSSPNPKVADVPIETRKEIARKVVEKKIPNTTRQLGEQLRKAHGVNTKGQATETAPELDYKINREADSDYRINQNHPAFQEFLEFQEFMSKKRAGASVGSR